jgi:hypothetical protein
MAQRKSKARAALPEETTPAPTETSPPAVLTVSAAAPENSGEADRRTAAAPEEPPTASADIRSRPAQTEAVATRAHDFDQITLGADKDSPRMRLLRSEKYQQLQIQFDEKPDAKYIARLHDEGWQWRNAEKVWTKQLDKDARWRTQADAQALFIEIGNGIRADLGFPAVQSLAR